LRDAAIDIAARERGRLVKEKPPVDDRRFFV